MPRSTRENTYRTTKIKVRSTTYYSSIGLISPLILHWWSLFCR